MNNRTGGMPGKPASGWRTTVNPHHSHKCQARPARSITRAMRKAGKVTGYHVPDYASMGDALADSVRASIARDMLTMLPDSV